MTSSYAARRAAGLAGGALAVLAVQMMIGPLDARQAAGLSACRSRSDSSLTFEEISDTPATATSSDLLAGAEARVADQARGQPPAAAPPAPGAEPWRWRPSARARRVGRLHG